VVVKFSVAAITIIPLVCTRDGVLSYPPPPIKTRVCPLVVAVGLAIVPPKVYPRIPLELVLCNSTRSVLFAPEILRLPRPAATVEDEVMTSGRSASGTIRMPTFPVVVAVVAATVLGVVAPTVPLILIEAVPVRFVTVPLVGVPSAPLNSTGAPALPVLTASAVATPVPRPDTPVLMGRPVQLVSVPLEGVPSAPPLTNSVELVGMVVPLSVVVLLDDRLVKAPVDGLEAPIAVFVRPTAE